MAAFAHDMERELRAKRSTMASAATFFGPTNEQPHQPWPVRTSIVNRPGTAASTSSIMMEKGSAIKTYATRNVATPAMPSRDLSADGGIWATVAAGDTYVEGAPVPLSGGDGDGGGGGELVGGGERAFSGRTRSVAGLSSSRSASRSGTAEEGPGLNDVSLRTLELQSRMRQANGALEIGMKQRAPR
jgi:hypothetical protein